MNRRVGRKLRKEFEKCLNRLGAFGRDRRAEVPDEYFVYRSKIHEKLFLLLVLICARTDDRFTIEIGWSRDGGYPDSTFAPFENGMDTSGEVFRVRCLWGGENNEDWWSVGEQASLENLIDFELNYDVSEQVKLVNSSVSEAFESIADYCAAYFEKVRCNDAGHSWPVHAVRLETECEELRVRFGEESPMDREAFYRFCQANSELRIERDAEGNIIVMAPTGTETGGRNASLTAQLYVWAKQDGTGKSFDSNTGFELLNGATRSPDAAWLTLKKWNGIPAEERQRFARVCPDFVIELRSPTDRLELLTAKMEEYIENGSKLGFLIDPIEETVRVYRSGGKIEMMRRPAKLSAGPEMPGLVFDLEDVW